MFQNNPLLAQLKQQIHDAKPKVEGVVRATDKAYGFLECDKESFFLPPSAMKKLMHGDKIFASITIDGDKKTAEPDALIEPMLTRFIGRINFHKGNRLQVFVDHPQIKTSIDAKIAKSIEQKLQQGDWVVAQLTKHPLRDNHFFYAEITQFICHSDDKLAPWWVTLARYEQPRHPVNGQTEYPMLDDIPRINLTNLHFVTIDSASTQDMDDALYLERSTTGWQLYVAIADPTAYISEDSEIEKAASQRCFTSYLPAFNIPMLPRELADDLCSLTPNQTKAALVCRIETDNSGNVIDNPEFMLANVQSKAKLIYDEVSDYIECLPNAWQPSDEETKQQIDHFYIFTQARIAWRRQHGLLFKETPDYSFELDNNNKVVAIHASFRRIANQIVEEAMILANICAAEFLQTRIGCGIFNTHSGFDPKFIVSAEVFLNSQIDKGNYSAEQLQTLDGYCQMRRTIAALSENFNNDYLEMRLRRFLTFATFKTEQAPHFGLGLTGYATWTSPIRKYSDMVNHRLIKAFLRGETTFTPPSQECLDRMQITRRQNRLVERDIADWLYCRFLAEKIDAKPVFTATIRDISRSNIRANINENGASIFIPASTICERKEDYQANLEELALYVQGKRKYQIGDQIQVQLTEVREDTRSIIGNIID